MIDDVWVKDRFCLVSEAGEIATHSRSTGRRFRRSCGCLGRRAERRGGTQRLYRARRERSRLCSAEAQHY
jgi:hypothetical protein